MERAVIKLEVTLIYDGKVNPNTVKQMFEKRAIVGSQGWCHLSLSENEIVGYELKIKEEC